MKRARRKRVFKGTLLMAILALGPATAGACRDERLEPELPEVHALSDLELGRIGGRIYNEPERAEEILAEVELTAESFEERVRTITDDPDRAREYTRGFESVAQLPVARDAPIPGADLPSDTGSTSETVTDPPPPG